MASHYCDTHGEYTGDLGCPECKEAESRAEEASQELSEKLDKLSEQHAEKLDELSEQHAEAVYRTSNPGDFECPSCKMISLKLRASRCPMCSGEVPEGYWVPILENILKQEREAEEKRQRYLASPEYAAEVARQKANELYAASQMARQSARQKANELYAASQKPRGKANIAMWLSIAGILCTPVSPAGFVLGIIALKEFKRYECQEGKGKAVVAVVLGGFFTFFVGVYLLAIVSDLFTKRR